MISSHPTNILLPVKTAQWFLLFFFLFLVICSFVLIPYSDSYYYLHWSKHLALSYYDGPPLIAYLLSIFSAIFGKQIYTINLFGVSCIYLTLWYLYKTAQILYNDKQASLNVCLLWILSTPVLHYLFLWVTYDNPLNLFWAAALYYAVAYLHFSKNLDLYCTSICLGLLLLSKYTGAILLLSFFLFMLFNSLGRKLFSNKHFYFANLIILALFSPVILWNYQHDWISFIYQYQYQLYIHGYPAGFFEALLRYTIKTLKLYDVLLILPMYVLFKYAYVFRNKPALSLLNIVSITFLISYLILSFKNSISKHWLTPFAISSSLLCIYYFKIFKLRKLYIFIIASYSIMAIYYLTANTFFQKYFNEDFFSSHLIQQAYLTKPADSVVVTSDWRMASKLFFWLPNTTSVYTLPCGEENQYSLWRGTGLPKSTQVLYLDFKDHSHCIQQYLHHCTALPTLSAQSHRIGFTYKIHKTELYRFKCYV